MTNQSETIITESDFASHIAGNDYLIVWPESDIDPRYGTYGFNKKKPQYPMIWSGNLHKRKDGLYYLNFTNEKFTGLTVWDPIMDGVRSEYYYIEGKTVLGHFYERGRLIERDVTRNGELVFEQGYWSDWLDPKKNVADKFIPYPELVIKDPNIIVNFYNNRVRKSKIVNDPRLLGVETHYLYFEEGPLKEIKTYDKEGKLTVRQVYENKPVQWESLGTERDPISTEYYETNGQVEIFDKHGNLKTETYREDGTLQSRWNYKNNELEGLSEGFYDNGQLKYRWNYKNGVKDGLWEYFDEEGNLTKTEEWKDGELVE